MMHMGYHTSSNGVTQFREVCYTVDSYAPFLLLQISTITNPCYFPGNHFFHPGPQPIMFYVCFNSTVLFVPCSLVISCWERADLLALLCVIFPCVFVIFPYGVLSQA